MQSYLLDWTAKILMDFATNYLRPTQQLQPPSLSHAM